MNKEIKNYILKYKLLKHLLIMLNMRDFIFFISNIKMQYIFCLKKKNIKREVEACFPFHVSFQKSNRMIV